ncbi:MAG: DUF4190 domain-containing protein [Sedimentisphaeraceae bacterium JB056]
MYCPKCGTLNPDDGKLCQVCSWVLRGEGNSTIAENPEAKMSKMAVTSLVLGILGAFTFGITILPAMILGLIAMFKIDRSAGRLRGKGFAIAGLCLTVFIFPIFMAIMMPALGQARGMAQRLICGENLIGLGIAVQVYANDNEGKVPEGYDWCDVLITDCDVSEKQFECPRMKEESSAYALNINAAGKELASLPADMVLLYESVPGWNNCGGSELLNVENHSGNGCNILFCDGQVSFIKTYELDYLIWTEEEAEEVGYAQD